MFYVNKLPHAPIGRKVKLPAYIVNNFGITALNTDDEFCIFRCLSTFRDSDKHDCELDTVAHGDLLTVCSVFKNTYHTLGSFALSYLGGAPQ